MFLKAHCVKKTWMLFHKPNYVTRYSNTHAEKYKSERNVSLADAAPLPYPNRWSGKPTNLNRHFEIFPSDADRKSL